MQETLVALVVIAVFVAIAIALVQWMGWQISPIIVKVAGILLVGIFLVIIIRLLWPLLMGGSLRLGMIAPMLGIGVG